MPSWYEVPARRHHNLTMFILSAEVQLAFINNIMVYISTLLQ